MDLSRCVVRSLFGFCCVGVGVFLGCCFLLGSYVSVHGQHFNSDVEAQANTPQHLPEPIGKHRKKPKRTLHPLECRIQDMNTVTKTPVIYFSTRSIGFLDFGVSTKSRSPKPTRQQLGLSQVALRLLWQTRQDTKQWKNSFTEAEPRGLFVFFLRFFL